MIVVTNLNDLGAGSLRQAIIDAVSGEEITFSVTGVINLVTGQLLINKNLIITGPGSGSIEVNGQVSARVFRVDAVASLTVSISGLTVRDGVDTDGGGIWNGEELTLTDVILVGNTALGNGGGLYNEGTVTLTDITINGCTCTGNGGGIYNSSTVSGGGIEISSCNSDVDGGGIWNTGTCGAFGIPVTDVAITVCTSGGDGAGVWNDATCELEGGEIISCVASNAVGGGGGAYNAGTLGLIEFSIISNNTTGNGDGIQNNLGTLNITRCCMASHGDIALYIIGGTTTIENSTVSSNGATAIVNTAFGAVTINHCTITLNNFGFANNSGEFCLLNVFDTILSGNVTGDYDGDTSDVISSGHNIFGNDTNPITPAAGDQIVLSFAALLIGPLQNNGGPTDTHAVLDGSPALDTGDNTGAPATDQRGEPRVVNSTIDIGAYETQVTVPPEPPGPPGPTPVPPDIEVPSAPVVTALLPCPIIPKECGFLATLADDSIPGIPNLSAELPDEDISTGLPYPPKWLQPPIVGGGNENNPGCPSCPPPQPPDQNWQDGFYGGPQPCSAPINGTFGLAMTGSSGAGACSPAVPPGNPTPPKQNPFVNPDSQLPNQVQSASATCPDGSIFTYTVQPRTYWAKDRDLANDMALKEAQRQVIYNKLCITGEFNDCCVGSLFFLTLVASGVRRSVTWSLTSGALPSGLRATQLENPMQLRISGTPNAAALFLFTLRVTDNVTGSGISRTYMVAVRNITTELESGETEVPYSQQMAFEGPTGDETTWFLFSGTLPTGLTLSESGLLSGTPTEAGTFSFSIGVTVDGSTCTHLYELQIVEAGCPAFLANYVYTHTPTAMEYVNGFMWVATRFAGLIEMKVAVPATGALSFTLTYGPGIGQISNILYATGSTLTFVSMFNTFSASNQVRQFDSATAADVALVEDNASLLGPYNVVKGHFYVSSAAVAGTRVYNDVGVAQYGCPNSDFAIPVYVPNTAPLNTPSYRDTLWVPNIGGTAGIDIYNASSGVFQFTVSSPPGITLLGGVYSDDAETVCLYGLDGGVATMFFFALNHFPLPESSSIVVPNGISVASPDSIRISPISGMVFVPGSGGTTIVINPATQSVVCSIATAVTAGTGAFDPVNERVWFKVATARVYQEHS